MITGPGTSDIDLDQGQVATPKNSRGWLWQGKIWPAFWTVASLLSLSVNILLIVILVLVGKQLFPLKQLLTQQLLGGLYYNFVQMDQAQIKTEVLVTDRIHVSDSIAVTFDLPLSQDTRVVLTRDTPINRILSSVCKKSFRPITGSSADCRIPGRS